MTGGNQKQLRAFTVMELLIVVMIFALASVSIATTFVNFTRLHRRAANAETLGEDLRFAMELMVRAARNNTIDYPALPAGITNPDTIINLISRTGAQTSFALFPSNATACSGLNADCLALSIDGGISWAPITGKNIFVDQFQVFVTPTHNPFEAIGFGSYNNDEQPRVTFVLDAHYVANNPREEATMSVQTSVSSRLYVR